MTVSIVGWRALSDYTKLDPHILLRATKLYDFPPCQKVRDGKKLYSTWPKSLVLDWLLENRHRPLVAAALNKKIAEVRDLNG